MPATQRAPSFQFYPSDWMADPGVQGLSWDERGRYHWALCCTRETARPGIATEDQWRRWMGYSKDDWEAHKEAYLPCFRIGRSGMWIQKRTVRDRNEQRNRHAKARKGGLATQLNRRTKLAEHESKHVLSTSSAATPSSSSSSSSSSSRDSKDLHQTPAQSRRAAEPRSGRIPAEGSVALPTNSNGEWRPTQGELDAWAEAYPALDVRGTMLEMRAWLIANPAKKKTVTGMPRFVNSWLAREQDRP